VAIISVQLRKILGQELIADPDPETMFNLLEFLLQG